MIEVFTIPALRDNYIYALRSVDGKTAVVDPSEPEPVHQFLKSRKWSLDFILNTHHHPDHTGGNLKLKEIYNCLIMGFEQDAHRIPGIDIHLKENETWKWGSHSAQILFIPGHTLGHIAFWFSKEKLVFCGDTLFGMGCGRVFEGTYQQMLSSLKKLAALPSDTLIYCGHEYTKENGEFALLVDGENKALKKRMTQVRKKQGQFTIPFLLSEEIKTNPFLNGGRLAQGGLTHPKLKQWIKNQNKPPSELEVFTQIRKLKDCF